MKPQKRIWGLALSSLGAIALLAGCASGDKKDEGVESGDAAAEVGSSGETLEFWGWNPAYESMVNEWNATHERQVKFELTASGSAGGYTRMQAAVTAGNAPCLAQFGNESITSFVVEGMMEDITDAMKPYEDGYDDSVLASVRVGDGLYGVPVDTAPMGMYLPHGCVRGSWA